MTKYVKISVLARETAKKVCRGREQWIRYLDVASRLYKYPFEDQLLIYAQRPDATACASLEMWNERMFCWINRGAKGIALIDGESERPKLRYVFDVSDVHKARRIGKDPFIWHLREEHKEVVLAELEHIYGSTNDSLPFENRIYEIAERIAEDFYEEAVDEVIDEAANSFLEDLDGDAVAVRVREMLVQSVSYTILKRCGCDMTEFADDLTFDYIHEFNTLRTLSVLGSTTSELCEPVLIRIGRTIARYDRALLQNRTYTGNHNHTERAVAGHESDIRKERGLSDSQSDTFGAGRNNADEIRSVAEELSEKPQEGRILRQGNRNDTVSIFRYVTEGTFDSYSWQVIENKQKFISQIMTSKSPVRSCEDVDEAALTYAEVKALATGNPYIKEKMDLDIQVSRLKLMKANHTSQIYRLEDNIAKNYPKQIEILQERIRGFQTDMETVRKNLPADKDNFSMKVGNRIFTDKKEAGTAILAMCQEMDSLQQTVEIGEYAGMKMKVTFDSFNRKFVMSLKGELSHNFELGSDAFGNITRLHNVLDGMAGKLSEAETKLNNVIHQLETAKMEVQKPFPAEEELKEKMERLAELDALLNMDEKGETPVLENEPTVTPLGEWLLEHLLPEFMEEYEMTEERAREVLLDALPEEESEVVCFSSEQNAESLDSEEMQKQMSEYMDGDFYAIPVSDTEYLIAPKVEQDSVIYLRSILSQLGDSVLSSPAMKSHAAYEYDSGTNRMKPFDHMRILRGLCAVGEEKHIYHAKSREPTETRTSNLAQVH